MPSNTQQTFRTHANYISAIRYVLSGGNLLNSKSSLELIASRVRDSGVLKSTKIYKADVAQVHHSLNNAWGVQALFKMGDMFIKEDDLVRLSNNWSIVQTYYILYYTTQALVISEGYSKPLTHPQVHRTYYLYWSKQPWLLSPWSISHDEDGFHNLPPGIFVDDSVHPWKRVEELTALSLFCKALRTTREELIKDGLTRRKQRIAKKEDKLLSRVRLTKNQKRETDVRIRPTMLINYLYRLKRKTNYEQSSMLAIGPENMYQLNEFRENLGFLIEANLLITEMITKNAVGVDTYYSWCKEWDKYKSPAMDIGPGNRMKIIGNL